MRIRPSFFFVTGLLVAQLWLGGEVQAQLTDITQTPNTAGRGIALSLEQQIGVGQGDAFTPGSSIN